jgi:hypothetical protein
MRKFSFNLIIAATETTSNSIDLGEYRPHAVILPVTTGTAFTFEISNNGTDFFEYKNNANQAYSIAKTAGSASAHYFAPAVLDGIRFVRAKSGSTEAAERTLTLLANGS